MLPDLPLLLHVLSPKSPASDRPSDIEPRHLVGPLLHVLAEQVRYQAHVPVLAYDEQNGLRDPFRDQVLRFAGFNPDDPTSMPASLWGTANPGGMYRRIWYARKRHCTTFTKTRKTSALFTQRDTYWTRLDGNARQVTEWSLTEPGVALASCIRPLYTNESNVTTAWLRGQVANGLYEKLLQIVQMDSAMRKERVSGEVLDHIHHYLAVAMTRDSFRSRLERGEPPTVRQIADWTVRKGISAFRAYSQDALQRTLRGALTTRERATGGVLPSSMVASDFQMVAQGSASSEDAFAAPEYVVVDRMAVERSLQQMSWDDGMNKVDEALRRHKTGAPERYSRVLGHMRNGLSVKEIGKAEGVSRNRAASLMADTRTALREAAQASRDAQTLLTYIQDEPNSTMDDIRTDLRLDTKIDWLLNELTTRGRIEAHEFTVRVKDPETKKIKAVTSTGYTISEKGVAFLAEWQLQPELQDDFGHRFNL